MPTQGSAGLAPTHPPRRSRTAPRVLRTIQTRSRSAQLSLVPDVADNTRFPFKSRLGFALHPSVISDALRHQHLLDPISSKHRQRQARLRTFVENFERMTPETRHTSRMLAATLGILYMPSTTETYFHIIVGMRPEYRDVHYREVARALRQEVARSRQRREPAEDERLGLRLGQAPLPLRLAMLLQMVTLSRHADVLAMRLRDVWRLPDGRLMLRVELPVWKSDLSGRHFASKAFLWPPAWEAPLALMWRTKPEYAEVYAHLQGVCTPHDLRRWAIAAASETHDGENVLRMTAHAHATAPTANIRRYAHPSPTSAESRLQSSISETIWSRLRTMGLTIPKLY